MKKKIICGLLALLLVLSMAGICSYALDENIRTMYKTIPIAGEMDSFEIIGSNSYRENTYKYEDTIYVESECIIECTKDVTEVQITKIKDGMTFEEFFEYQSQYIKDNSTFPPVDYCLSKFDYGNGIKDRIKLKEGKYVVGVICAGNGVYVNLIVGSDYESEEKTDSPDYRKIYMDFAADADNNSSNDLNKETSGMIMADLNNDKIPELLTFSTNSRTVIKCDESLYESEEDRGVKDEYNEINKGFSIIDGKIVKSTVFGPANPPDVITSNFILLPFSPDDVHYDTEEFCTLGLNKNNEVQLIMYDVSITGQQFSMIGYDGNEFGFEIQCENIDFFNTHNFTDLPLAGVQLYNKEKNKTRTYTEAMELLLDKYDSQSGNMIEVVVNGKKLIFDNQPQIVDGRTLIPIRAVSEALGANVEWDIMTQCVTISRGNDNIVMAVNKNTYLKNGNTLTLDVPPQIVNSRTLVPIRVIAESYGCEVTWDAANKRVIIEG